MPENKRWAATTERLTVERRGEEPLEFEPGAECKGVPDNWPPKWLQDAGLVVEIKEDPKDEPESSTVKATRSTAERRENG